MKYLFICKGNVGRSQMAEAFCNTFANEQISWSAGVQKDTPSKYANPTKGINEMMKEKGIDVSQAKVKTVNEEMIAGSQNIIVLCEKSECPSFIQNSNKVTYWKDIKDPYLLGVEDVKKIRGRIENNVRELLK